MAEDVEAALAVAHARARRLDRVLAHRRFVARVSDATGVPEADVEDIAFMALGVAVGSPAGTAASLDAFFRLCERRLRPPPRSPGRLDVSLFDLLEAADAP